MKFILLDDGYYNTALIGYAKEIEVDGEIHRFIQLIGGELKEVTEEEFNRIIEEQ